jgi:hypothetical protein
MSAARVSTGFVNLSHQGYISGRFSLPSVPTVKRTGAVRERAQMTQLMAPSAAAGTFGMLRLKTPDTKVFDRDGLTNVRCGRDASAEPTSFGSRGLIQRTVDGCSSASQSSHREQPGVLVMRTEQGTANVAPALGRSTIHRDIQCPFELDSV